MPPRRGCRLAVANEALLHNAQFVIIRPIPTTFTVSRGKNFDLRAVEKVGHKVGLTIGSIPRSDGRPRRLTPLVSGRTLGSKLKEVHDGDVVVVNLKISRSTYEAARTIAGSSNARSPGEVRDAMTAEDYLSQILDTNLGD